MRLFCDCKTDEEKSNFFLSGMAVETGVIAPAISNDVAMAYHRCAQFKKENDELRARIEAMEKQEPVAHYKDAPHTIYLQTGCDDPEDCECSFNEWGGTTWCADQIHDTDIPYIRADYAAPVSAKREWVDLTDDEIDLIEQQVYCRTTQKGRPLGVYAVELVRAVIAAFKEKQK